MPVIYDSFASDLDAPKIIVNYRRDFFKTALTAALAIAPLQSLADGKDAVQQQGFENFLTISSGGKIVKTSSRYLFIERYGRLYNFEFADAQGNLKGEGYESLSRLFGDYNALQAIRMDPELFYVLHRTQQWLFANGYSKPIVLTSGFRTVMTNANTEGAAQFSMHPKGKAADIKAIGIKPYDIARIARYFGGTGIGMYDTFTHIDTGRLRQWRG